MSDFDAIVVGAGVAGLGQAAMLQQAGKKTLLVDRWPRPGGRLQSYPLNGWVIENGLHIVEMGKKGYCHEMAAGVGVEIEWGEWTDGGEFYIDGQWVERRDLIQQEPGRDAALRGSPVPDSAAWRRATSPTGTTAP